MVYLYGPEILLFKVNQKKLQILNAIIICLWYWTFTERNRFLCGSHLTSTLCIPVKLLWLMKMICLTWLLLQISSQGEKKSHDWPVYSCNNWVRIILECSLIVCDLDNWCNLRNFYPATDLSTFSTHTSILQE